MRFWQFFKKFMMVAGFAAFFATGYISTSVVTSCPASAQACHCNLCTYGGAMTAALGIINASVTLPGLAFAQSAILVWFNTAIAGYSAKITGELRTLEGNQMMWWDTFWYYNMLPAMQAMTDQLTTADSDQGRVIGSFADAQDFNRTNLAYQGDELDSHRSQRPDELACTTATNAASMSRTDQFRDAYSRAAPAERLGRTAANADTPAAQGTVADVAARTQEYETTFCDAAANGGNNLCTSDAPLAGRDLDVTGEIFSKETIDLTNDDTKAVVDELVTNIAEPFVNGPMLPTASSTVAGRELLLEAERYKAQRQVVYDAIYFIIARRAPGSATDEFIRSLRQSAGIDNADISTNPSHAEIMEVMASERFRTGRYAVAGVSEPEAAARELVIQQAFGAIQMNDVLDLVDRYALLLAADASRELEVNAGDRESGAGEVNLR